MSVAQRRISRAECSNCTCSPGLLSRNRRSSTFAKRISIKRFNSQSGSPKGSRKGSVYTIDAASLCVPEIKEVNTSARLEKLRKLMKENDLGVYVIPSEDQHQSEYVAPVDQRRAFISGFSGSAGVAVVTRDVNSFGEVPEGSAALATDGRYFTQATNELDFNWTLLKQGQKDVLSWEKWAVQQAIQLSVDSGKLVKIGVDPKLISFSSFDKITKAIEEETKKKTEAQVELVPVKKNLVDAIWPEFEEVPPVPENIIKVLDEKFAGEGVKAKITKVIDAVKENNCDGIIISALDEVAWLLNLRGSDIQYNPVFYSYVIIDADKESVTLYANNKKFDSPVSSHLEKNNVKVKPYESFWEELSKVSKSFKESKKSFLLDEGSASWDIVRTLNCEHVHVSPTPVENLKAIKNSTELEGAKLAHLKDGRALCKFFAWLEEEVANKVELINEVEADQKLFELRSEEANFVGLSFDTISASGANGAIIHYKPTKEACATIDPSKIYLNDSGAQYLEGTTDTTRCVHFGTPTQEEIDNYTLVLKGNIALGSLKFPEKTPLTDTVARQYLWKQGKDFGHGTSHGIGAFLNVHEGPIGLGPRANPKNLLKPGHLLSNEPGYYEEGEYGIRIENVMFVKPSGYEYNGKKFNEFETVTRVPFCRRLINQNMLTKEEKEWIDDYHKTIWKELSGSFIKNTIEWAWLKRETASLK
ncbi:hypothetical protein ACI3LY_001564 [Candidozyma auris]|uniref:Xaa-Pro aminopeptidase n=2 Tax=Candidozyma auris TaxID=498019 RepID=A0A2H0ZY21_CANAR|nr:hypothetical protein B9J08_001642 [[Candida] auris]QWW22807.1 hypothetical protein CA7LBN_001554 [[Candida] auris]